MPVLYAWNEIFVSWTKILTNATEKLVKIKLTVKIINLKRSTYIV